MFLYILPEFLVLICVMTQQFYEILLGVHQKREIFIENISEARERFLDQFNQQALKIKSTLVSMKRPAIPVNGSNKHGHQNQQEEQRVERSNALDFSDVSPYVPPMFGSNPLIQEQKQHMTEKMEDSQFKFLLGELKKVKKEVVKS